MQVSRHGGIHASDICLCHHRFRTSANTYESRLIPKDMCLHVSVGFLQLCAREREEKVYMLLMDVIVKPIKVVGLSQLIGHPLIVGILSGSLVFAMMAWECLPLRFFPTKSGIASTSWTCWTRAARALVELRGTRPPIDPLDGSFQLALCIAHAALHHFSYRIYTLGPQGQEGQEVLIWILMQSDNPIVTK